MRVTLEYAPNKYTWLWGLIAVEGADVFVPLRAHNGKPYSFCATAVNLLRGREAKRPTVKGTRCLFDVSAERPEQHPERALTHITWTKAYLLRQPLWFDVGSGRKKPQVVATRSQAALLRKFFPGGECWVQHVDTIIPEAVCGV